MPQKLNVEIISEGSGWRLSRVEIHREPLLGAMVEASALQRTWIVERGCVCIVRATEAWVFGAGHPIVIPAGEGFLVVGHAAVCWVISAGEGAVGVPTVQAKKVGSAPLPLPLCEPEHPLWPASLRAWSALPNDVATWASELGIHGTSLAQRCQRLAGVTPKQLLGACRATLAWELASDRSGAELAEILRYSSASHLSADIRARHGHALGTLRANEASPERDWLLLMKAALR